MNRAIFGLALLLAGTAANAAVTFTSMPGPNDVGVTAPEHIIVDFEAPTTGVVYGGSYTIDDGSVAGVRAPPAGDTSMYFATPGETSPTSSGSATIDFTGYIATHGEFRSLSFFWGSIDDYNTLQIFGAGGLLRTLTGTEVIVPANGDQSAAATNRRLFLTFAPGDQFRSLKLTSGARAFEIDNIAASVPEPTTWATLVGGLAFVGLAMRRRRDTRSVTA